MDKLVSIVLPVYNGQKYLSESIESVLSQTYKNIELIIVDDCSTDNSLAIATSYAMHDSRVKIISNQINQKLPESLNIGFNHSSGDFLTWTSDDNRFHKCAIDKMVSVLNSNEDIDFVYSNYSLIDACGNFISNIFTGDCFDLKFGNPIGASFLYTKKLSKLVGLYDTNMILAEDYDYWIRCLQYGKFVKIDDILYDYRMHSQNLSSKNTSAVLAQAYAVKRKNFNFLLSLCNNNDIKFEFYHQCIDYASHEEKLRMLSYIYAIDKTFFIHNISYIFKLCAKELIRYGFREIGILNFHTV